MRIEACSRDRDGLGQAWFCFILIGQYTIRTTANGSTRTFPAGLNIPGPLGLADGERGFLSCFNLNMAADYSLAADSRTVNLGDGATYRVEWTTFRPEFTPADSTPG